MARKSDSRQGQPGAGQGRDAAEAAGAWPPGAGRAAGARQGRDPGRVLRVLALIAVAVGLAGLTAAACVLSYSSVHHLAIQAGVYGRLANVYPLIFDAMLVVAGCSVLALRGAGLVSRVYSWLCLLVLLAALAAGGAVRAASVTVPHKPAAVVAAILPWALVLIGFGLLLALLRYARLRRLGKRNGRPADDGQRTPALAPAAVSAPDSERERAQQGPLIPGLPPGPQAIAAPDPQDAGAKTGAAANPGRGRSGRPVTPGPVTPGPVTAGPVTAGPVTAGPVTADPPLPAAAGRVSADKAPESRDRAGRAIEAAGTARPAEFGQGVEPPTVPGAAARPATGLPARAAAGQAEESAEGARTRHDEKAAAAGQTAAGQAAAGQPATGQPAAGPPATGQAAAGPPATGQAAAEAGGSTPPRPGVRRADLQLRARIPKQPAHEQTEANPVPPGWPTPFMPKVGQHESPAQQAAGAAQPPGAGQPARPGSADAARQAAGPAGQPTAGPAAEPAATPSARGANAAAAPTGSEHAARLEAAETADTTVAALPKRVPGQQPVTSGFETAAAPASGTANPPTGADAGGAGGAPGDAEPGDATGSADASTLSAAPTASDEDDEPGGLPAFRRTRSSPTPPRGDEGSG